MSAWDLLGSDSHDRFVKVVVSDLRGYLDEPCSERMTKYALDSVLKSAAFVYTTGQRQLGKGTVTVDYDHGVLSCNGNRLDFSARCDVEYLIVEGQSLHEEVLIRFPWTSEHAKLQAGAIDFLQFIFRSFDLADA